MDENALSQLYIERLQILFETYPRSWALFAHGTCVFIGDEVGDIAQEAKSFIATHGPYHVASPSADFNVTNLAHSKFPHVPGWLVTYDNPNIITYVAPEELAADSPPQDLVVGLLGRSKRAQDGEERTIIHVRKV
jgi:hypothetical protein